MPADHAVCPIPGCRATKRMDDLFCRRHWNQVPRDIQSRIWLYFRTEQGSPKHLNAIADAYRALQAHHDTATSILTQPQLFEL